MSVYSRGNEVIFESDEPREAGGDASTAPLTAASAAARGAVPLDGDVDHASLRPAAAFEVFQGRVFDVAAYDGAVSRADSVERRVESPLQRFARLRSELADLKADLDVMTAGGAASSADDGSNIWAVLQRETERMVADASSMEEEHPALASYRAARSGSPMAHSELTSQLHSLLVASQEHGLASIALPGNSTSTGSSTEAIASAPLAPLDAATAAQLTQLEKRIFALETLIGVTSNVMDVEGVSSQSSGGTKLLALPGRGAFVFPLAETVANLTSRVALVLKAAEADGEAFASVRSRINTMKSDLETLQRERAKLPGTDARVLEAAASLQDLHKKLKLVEAFASDIPTLLLRLKSLERLHVDAATFGSRLAELEDQCRVIQARVESNAAVLREVKEGMEANLATMLENIKSVDSRINALKAKGKA